MTTRPASWYVGWLGRDAVFSPQPYRQLASVFREAGADETADSILYALRNRERNVAWEQGDYLGWLELSALKWVIGYGIGGRYFRALFWAVGFTVLGTWVLWSGSEEAQIMKGPGWCIWASLDEILPIVQLDKAHEEFINQRLDGWCRSYFYVHRIVAYVLGSFVVAGLAGLTQGL